MEGAMIPEAARSARPVEAYQKLRELIVSGRLAPGTRLIETEVADRLGLSRTPVRSALNRLLREGYVVAGPGSRRTRLAVAPLTKEDAAEVFTLVAVVEGLAGQYAAQLPGSPRGRLTAELRATNADLRSAATQGVGGQRYFDLDQAFHRCYVEASGHRRVIALHDSIKPQAERYVRVYTTALTDEITTSVKEHEAIIDAIEGGNPDGARRAVRANFMNATERLGQIIETFGEQGSW